MTKRKTYIILSIILVLSIIVSVFTTFSVSANNNKTFEQKITEGTALRMSEKRDDVAQKRQISYLNQKKSIVYKNTFYYNMEECVHEYFDTDDNQYDIDDANRLVGFNLGYDGSSQCENEFMNSGNVVISEENAIAIAQAKLKMLFPDIADDFIITYNSYGEYENTYSIEFCKMYGEGDFAIGERFNIHVYATGDVIRWTMSGLEHIDGFDESILDGITESEVIEYAKEQLDARVAGASAECDSALIHIRKISDVYALRVTLYSEEGMLENVYYEI